MKTNIPGYSIDEKGVVQLSDLTKLDAIKVQRQAYKQKLQIEMSIDRLIKKCAELEARIEVLERD